MNYRIIVDSCGELTEEMKSSGVFKTVPLSIELGDETIVDDANFNQASFLQKVKESAVGPKSSCPSPGVFAQSYNCEAERIYVVTISTLLSGTNNSAELGKSLYEEEFGKKQIHVFNSKTASVGETLIAYKIWLCEQAGMSFEEVIETVESYIDKQNTYFVLESLDVLIKTGRLSGMKQVVATALNIKPIMGATKEGSIFQHGKARGIRKAIPKMVEIITSQVENSEEKFLAIAHCNCIERAQEVQQLILDKIKVKGCLIVDTSGISTMYANDGGVIVAI